MKAVIVDAFGEAPEMSVRDAAMPEPGAQEVRVNIAAAGINPVDTYNVKDPSWAGISTPCILGYDIAGTVDAVGAGVDPALVGKRVMAMTSFPAGQGGYAEYTVVSSDLLAVVSDDADLVAAASIPLAAGT
ncbi:MAG: zinc-binding alcohol dehydrogenase family protein, partial [Candidatus Nanopelagicales bacterium]